MDMKIEGKGKLLKIFIGEPDKWHGESLYHAVLKRVKEQGLAGATIDRGIEGFGANSRVHTSRIEVIDKEEMISQLLEIIEPMITEGLIVIMHDVEIIKYAKSKDNSVSSQK